MNDNLKLERAIELALKYHKNQVDKGNKPYILHSLRVMCNFTQVKYQIVSILHDIIEYTPCSFDELNFLDDEIIDAIKLLTHKKGVSYSEYIKAIKENELAKGVKLAELRDNMDSKRREDVEKLLNEKGNEKFERKLRVYKNAYDFLKGKLIFY